jgi:RNA polymerase sigma factor (sigma-70 family)
MKQLGKTMPLPNQSGAPENETCWTLIHAAADGSQTALSQFAERYQATVRKTLAARWNYSRRIDWIDDAVQEVFVECIRPGGALSKADSRFSGGFRAYLFGVTRNVILRYESRPIAGQLDPEDVISDEATFGEVFDREYARAIMKEASQLQLRNAEAQGDAAIRRVELLHARFFDGLPIRAIAELWCVDPAWLHHEYSKARDEFLTALLEVVSASQPSATHAENQATCKDLLGMLK